MGEPYFFSPTAADLDGDTLTFDIENRPGWASFDTGPGRISGIPMLANTGTFSNIRVSVSDGQNSAILSAFAIEVTQVATASTTLSWTAPIMNDDGTTLTDSCGIQYLLRKSSGNYRNTIEINNPSVTIFVVDNLSPDTYYFAATAVTDAGEESQCSGESMRNLN